MSDVNYDQWMLDCLAVAGWNRRQAIQLFTNSVLQTDPSKTWITSYAYKVYDRVCGAAETATPIKKLLTEHAQHLRAASEATLERGYSTGDWNPFISVSNTIIKATGLDKKDVNVHVGGQHVHMSRPPEEIRNRIDELQSIVTRGMLPTSVGGVQLPDANKPTVDIPSPPKAVDYPAVSS